MTAGGTWSSRLARDEGAHFHFLDNLFTTKVDGDRSGGVLTAMEAAHPTEPEHWYLAILGTDPKHQGQGIGSALIKAVTDRCDEQGMAAYLESSKPENVPFYARHGFEVTEEKTFDGGPSVWLMWRDPQEPAAS